MQTHEAEVQCLIDHQPAKEDVACQWENEELVNEIKDEKRELSAQVDVLTEEVKNLKFQLSSTTMENSTSNDVRSTASIHPHNCFFDLETQKLRTSSDRVSSLVKEQRGSSSGTSGKNRRTHQSCAIHRRCSWFDQNPLLILFSSEMNIQFKTENNRIEFKHWKETWRK